MPRLLLLGLTCVALAACAQTPPPEPPSNPSGRAKATASRAPESSSSGVQNDSDPRTYLKPAMAYADARRNLLVRGWEPLRDEQCLANVVGANFKDICTPDNAMCRVCEDLPELSAYSSDAHALSQFRDRTGRILRLTSLGEIRSWNAPPPDADLQVLSWEVVPASSP